MIEFIYSPLFIEGLLWPGPVLPAIRTPQIPQWKEVFLSLTLSLPGSSQTQGIEGSAFCTHCQIPKTKRQWWVRTDAYPSSEALGAKALWGSPRALGAWWLFSEVLAGPFPWDGLLGGRAAGPSSHPFSRPWPALARLLACRRPSRSSSVGAGILRDTLYP